MDILPEFVDEVAAVPAITEVESRVKIDIMPTREFTNDDLINSVKILVRKGAYAVKHTLSLQSVVDMIQTDDFILNVLMNQKRIYAHKSILYARLLTNIRDDISRDQKSINFVYHLNHVQDSFPLLQRNKILQARLQQIQNIINEKVVKLAGIYNLQTLLAAPDVLHELRTNLIAAVCDKKHGIQSIIGRTDVKQQLLQQIYLLSKTHTVYIDSFLNIIITGASGAGKTKLAHVLGFLYSKMGVLLTDTVTITSPADFVSMYIGATAGKACGVLMHAIEGVLFVDEVYSISDSKERTTHGDEALTEIVNFLDKYVGLSIVIGAGYKKQIDEMFLGSNEGLSRRFPFRYNLDKYSPSDLTNLLLQFITPKFDVLPDFDLRFLYTMIVNLNKFNVLPNQAGDVMTLANFLVAAYYMSENKENTQEVIIEAIHYYLNSNGATFDIKA